MDLRILDPAVDYAADYAATVFPGTDAPPAAEPAATDKPVSSGVAEVKAPPGMAPYGDVCQVRRPANDAAQEALIPVADLRDSASSGADNPVGSDPSSAEPELQGPITSPASPADPAAPAQKPLTVAGDIQPARAPFRFKATSQMASPRRWKHMRAS